MNTIQLFQMERDRCSPITLPDMTSLDTITRQLPNGYYSTFRTYANCTLVIGLAAHLRRLPHVDASTLRCNLLPLLKPYRLSDEEARIRVIETKKRQFYIAIEPLKLLPRDVYENGVRVETIPLYRQDPRTKSTAFISISNQERKHIAEAGLFEALLVKNGRILEGMTSNFFYVAQVGRLQYLGTAEHGILPGVTRTMVIRAAQGRGVAVKYRSLKLDQLSTAKEAFITSSSRGIVPVIQIDSVQVGQGRLGRITQRLTAAYEEYVLKHAEEV